MMGLPDNVSYLEVLWTLIGVLPFFLGVFYLRGLMRDRRFLKNDGVNGADDIVVGTWIGVVCLELVCTGAIACIGVVAMFIPAAAANSVTPTGVVITVGFVAIGCASAAVMVWVIVRRLKLRLYLQTKYSVGHISQINQSATGPRLPEPPVDAL